MADVTEEQKDEKFLAEYEKLCAKDKRNVIGVPGWRFSQDGNDYRLVIELKVARQE